MHFGLTEEQELLQQTVRSFIDGECPPPRLREMFDNGEAAGQRALWRGMTEMGLSALLIPEEHDGAGLEILDLALVCEVAGGGALPSALLEHSLACLAIREGGSEEQRQRWLPKLASGELLGTIAWAEDPHSWEPASWTAAVGDGNLSASKTYVPHAAEASLFVVGLTGGALGVVLAESTSDIAIEDQQGIDRTRPIGQVRFEGVACELLPKSQGDLGVARLVRDAGLVGLAADAFGAATRLVHFANDYAKERKQFGSAIGQFQAVKHQIARIGTEIEPTRALFWYAAHALDAGLEDAERSCAMAKSHITDRAIEIARAAVELHGGLGFTWECDVQMWFKRVMFDRALLGTPEQHRERCATLAGW